MWACLPVCGSRKVVCACLSSRNILHVHTHLIEYIHVVLLINMHVMHNFCNVKVHAL